MNTQWQNVLPHPIAFVLSGGAALGAIQAGMLQALRQAGIYPDLVVGTSVGALNGAAIADRGLDDSVDLLAELWRQMQRKDVFPGGLIAQARHLLTHRTSLFPNDALVDLGCRMLSATRFADLQMPFGALTTELMSYHGALFTSGELHPTLLASSAIPGVYPPVEINGTLYVDGGLTANVPLSGAVQMGAASLVVLDVGDACHLEREPRHVADMMAMALHTALRQRVLIEAPVVAQRLPVLYIPSPCPLSSGFLDFSLGAALMEQAQEMAAAFLQDAPPPQPGRMVGDPHYHEEMGLTGFIQMVSA